MSDSGPDPEAEAREVIDKQLKRAGWVDLDEEDSHCIPLKLLRIGDE